MKIEHAHRTGAKREDTSRTIVAKFSSYNTKAMILINARKLKDMGYYLNKDFSKDTAEIRKENWKKVKDLGKNGKYAILAYDNVFWRGKRSSENTP